MGFIDGILGKGHEEGGAAGVLPMFSISTSFRPVRLAAKKEENVELELVVRNISEGETMASVNVDIPKGLGFDGMGIARAKEFRLGQLKSNEEKKFSVSLHGNSHAVKKAVELRVI